MRICILLTLARSGGNEKVSSEDWIKSNVPGCNSVFTMTEKQHLLLASGTFCGKSVETVVLESLDQEIAWSRLLISVRVAGVLE